MISKFRPGFCVIVLGVLLLASTSAYGVAASRIVLTDGTVYEDVEFTVEDFNVIAIQDGDKNINVNVTQVAKILDQAGNDITAQFVQTVRRPAVGQYLIDHLALDLQQIGDLLKKSS